MLIFEAWDGSGWRVIGRLADGTRRMLLNHRTRDGGQEALYIAAECDHATISAADHEQLRELVRLEPGDSWERVLDTDRMPATLCRLRHTTAA